MHTPIPGIRRTRKEEDQDLSQVVQKDEEDEGAGGIGLGKREKVLSQVMSTTSSLSYYFYSFSRVLPLHTCPARRPSSSWRGHARTRRKTPSGCAWEWSRCRSRCPPPLPPRRPSMFLQRPLPLPLWPEAPAARQPAR